MPPSSPILALGRLQFWKIWVNYVDVAVTIVSFMEAQCASVLRGQLRWSDAHSKAFCIVTVFKLENLVIEARGGNT